ncbi:alpha/beta fold hydrolase [Duganella sp. CY15W]|uniref:thioesterase II family protein n=1 Tax=Duganella sp. CY15W TaxID=2692172 RepID=UPI001371DD16|nr:alpha/beta fold hydrolase [Duganella sp. CY15W]MYM28006.1 alpha/beta fold hydrolase [Duganella sp. CY15W]
MTIHETQRWFIRQPASTRPRMRLYCFAYAGGSAAVYGGWQRELDPAIEVVAIELPGRGSRFSEKPVSNFFWLVQELAYAIAAQERLPFAFFGHSLGGLLAFEVARYCKLRLLPQPCQLMVSGSAAPGMRKPGRNLHLLPDEDLMTELKSYNGTPAAVLESAELMAMLLPMIRADFGLVDSYRYRLAPLLDMPLTVLAGRGDPHVTQDQASAWSTETSADSRVIWLEGDHFFIHGARAAVLDAVRDTLTGKVPG